MLDLRGSIPSFILITDGNYYDSNVLDVMVPISNAIYLMDKAYVDFTALYRMQQAGAFFVTRPITSLKYRVIEQNFNFDESTGLRAGKTVMLTVYRSKKQYPEKLRLIEFYDSEKEVKEQLDLFCC